ncbi:MAG: PSD1 domain-containing protein [Pyrinomonadaceae bacterium]|nr:PSD1 domain-containing protein [Phycisphaerales bacterium]
MTTSAKGIVLAVAGASVVVSLLCAVGLGVGVSPNDEAATAELRLGLHDRHVADGSAGSAQHTTPHVPQTVRYGRDVRPILSDRCYQCHGPDPETRQAGLRLDIREDAIAPRKDGRPAIVPGEASASELWHRINTPDASEMMPPTESHKRALSAEEKEVLKRWIDAGAAYEPHWAFVAPKRPEPPAPKNTSWCRNDIDRFVLTRLEAEGIAPSPEAPRESLLRRVYLDLTGLPPTPEELDAYLADTRPDAYDRVVDQLLTQEPYRTRYAERMAATWMDQARYADTSGIHMDAGRQTWLWRDWVINAYQSNMPLDTFVIEQLAGDLIPGATDQQKVATGFNRNHVTSDEGGAIAEEYLVEYAVDRTATTGSVFLGLTVGCARCHDHKFDPVTAEDFYKMYAYFNSIEEPGLYSQVPDANRALEPFMQVPNKEQKAKLGELDDQLKDLRAKQEIRSPEEDSQRLAFFADVARRAGVVWAQVDVISARSEGGATMEAQSDGSIRATGTNPPKDEHHITLRTQGTNLKLISLEALPEPTAVHGRLGRADNGNAVVNGVDIEAVSIADASKKKLLRLVWAWADHSQQNGDFDITNVIDSSDDRGWALQGYAGQVSRMALLMTDEPFGYEGGTELRVHLHYDSMYSQHVLARVRLGVGSLNDAGVAMLPTASSRWNVVGPFGGDPANNKVFEPAFGPEQDATLDFSKKYTSGKEQLSWSFSEALVDDKVVGLAEGRNVSYLGRYLYSPVAREVPVSLGSDDGFRLYVNGKEVAQRNTERGVAPDQDKATIPLAPGRNTLIFKVVNTGGAAGYFYRATHTSDLTGALVASLLPEDRRGGELASHIEQAWRRSFLPVYKETEARITELEKDAAEIRSKVPLTMVMKELPTPRPTFVLSRGQYDHPDKARPVTRGIPTWLSPLPDGAPANRLGLAQWITAADNPLFARVTVNRLWEIAFGTGIVKTSEDFGLQGEWPSHPELLDWLAVELRQGGYDDRGGRWDMQHMLRLIVTSATYRQSSTTRADVRERDPDNRLLASYPRRRLSAEQIRDQALFVSGLLKEQVGGPSVKPYQPPGLWQEVAMPQSNTREYKRGEMADLWRRSLYTYWKRAAPPPSMLTFDAPTRESCTTHRASTSTPLQALVLWNDEQFVEAARVLGERTITEQGDDSAKVSRLFKRCTSRAPDGAELKKLIAALGYFRERYKETPADADGMLKAGMAPLSEKIDKSELAAWTMIASAVMNLYESTTQE